MTTQPQQPASGRWLFIPSDIPADTIDETISLGYSDFFISELTSDSEDSETGVKLTLAQRRARHQEKRAARKNKWKPTSKPDVPLPMSPPPQPPTLSDDEIKRIKTHDTVQGLIESLRLLNVRMEGLLTTNLSEDAELKATQIEAVSTAISSATFVLDSMDSGAGDSGDESVAVTVAGETAETRAGKLGVLADRIKLYSEKLRDQSGSGEIVASRAEKHKGRKIDTAIRRVEREIKKAGM
ncbi:hypothetical protein HDU79_002749 [Rhizoclosmatium sp. JEL0117]|nr:hypothetical protein HDU79_002749 [Rhizoclosmatium sp. JEL0117]